MFSSFEILCLIFVCFCSYFSFRNGQKSREFAVEEVAGAVLNQLEVEGIIHIDKISGDISPVQKKL